MFENNIMHKFVSLFVRVYSPSKLEPFHIHGFFTRLRIEENTDRDMEWKDTE